MTGLDWKCKTDYDALEQQVLSGNPCSRNLQWAWEFLRRSPQYIDDVAGIVPSTDPLVTGLQWAKAIDFARKHWMLEPNDPLLPFSRTIGADMLVMAVPSMSSKELPSTSQVGSLSFTINVVGDCSSQLRWIESAINKYAERYGKSWIESEFARYFALDIANNGPIDSCSNEKEVLREIAKGLPDVAGNVTDKKFPQYLRLLDANEARVSVSQMVNAIYGQDSACDKTIVDHVRDDQLPAAMRWRDGRYRLLIRRALLTADPADPSLQQSIAKRQSIDPEFSYRMD